MSHVITQISEKKALIWHLDCRNIDPIWWSKLVELLSLDERIRADKFYFEHDRKSYIAAHALTRAMLALVIKCRPESIEFVTDDFGKPELITSTKTFPKLRINLSHTRHAVMVGLTMEHDIGVDIEWLGRNDRCLELANTVLTPEERLVIKNTKDHQKKQYFLKLWTLKEAYIKAIGKGLSLPLTDFYFSLDPLSIHFKIEREPTNIHHCKYWHFMPIQPGPDHVAAIAIHSTTSSKIDFKIEAAPLSTIAQRFFDLM